MLKRMLIALVILGGFTVAATNANAFWRQRAYYNGAYGANYRPYYAQPYYGRAPYRSYYRGGYYGGPGYYNNYYGSGVGVGVVPGVGVGVGVGPAIGAGVGIY